MVLADNVDGGDDLDLVVTTMNGNVFCFSTPSPNHPLKAGYILKLTSEFIFKKVVMLVTLATLHHISGMEIP